MTREHLKTTAFAAALLAAGAISHAWLAGSAEAQNRNSSPPPAPRHVGIATSADGSVAWIIESGATMPKRCRVESRQNQGDVVNCVFPAF